VNWGVKNDIDFIAASFVRKGSDLTFIREVLAKSGDPKASGIKIISKIENVEGLENYPDILQKSDGIMVARGDLGMEIVRFCLMVLVPREKFGCGCPAEPLAHSHPRFRTLVIDSLRRRSSWRRSG
jgi:hypothetical protein